MYSELHFIYGLYIISELVICIQLENSDWNTFQYWCITIKRKCITIKRKCMTIKRKCVTIKRKCSCERKVMYLTENRITLFPILERFAASATKLHERDVGTKAKLWRNHKVLSGAFLLTAWQPAALAQFYEFINFVISYLGGTLSSSSSSSKLLSP